MSINLCVDWGNTNIKAAIFDNDKLQKQVVCDEGTAVQKVSELMDTYKPVKAITCSVAVHGEELENMIVSRIKGAIKLDAKTRLPINNAYGTPESLGADRVALVCGAHLTNPDNNNLVISLGTCITYNLMQKNKTFRGGAISPGMHMRLKAMHDYTDKLPEISVQGDLLLVGYDTETCMRGGVVFGMAAEIDGMIKEYEAKYPEFNAILTGGDAAFFATKIKSKIFADPDLLLKGLNLILNYNVSFPR